MQWYSLVKRYYDAGYYTNDNVRVFVEANKITAAQYQEITDEEYEGSAA